MERLAFAMEIRRFFVQPTDIVDNNVRLCGEEFHHAVKVLRHKVGFKIIVCDNSGNDYYATITEIRKDALTAKIDEVVANDTATSRKFTLYQCISRGDRLDFAVQKAVELGVREIVPVISDFSTEKAVNHDRLTRIISEAAKQCGLAILPTLTAPMTFADAVKRAGDTAIVFYEHEEKVIIDKSALPKGDVGVFVGAEGGFSPEEIEFARQSGARTVSLGKRILRTETATVAALTLTVYLAGEMNL